ncbi:unnamed protein product [Cylindrotheca closterium]|uniref:FAD/NAD(P)-binding domain-containing protein n=1 Tax=Cylindrotheca closterium TaxID=2856 RepID=A0AAD2GB39_9STRA|nr:unnamed protein product [Cylindrotheca closterium]
MESNTHNTCSTTYDVYDIDGTLTRPGHDLWYLTTKSLVKDEVAFDNRVKRWKKEVKEKEKENDNDAVMNDATESNMKDSIHMVAAATNSDGVLQKAKSIASDLMRQGIVSSEWATFVKQRIAQGATPILSTTNYEEGAQGLIQALLEATWITQEEADKFLVSGTKVNWSDRSIVHFNMDTKKAMGILQATGKDSLSELENAVENVFGNDPLGGAKDNAKLELPPRMHRMSWLHWRDTEKHRMPVGLMNVAIETNMTRRNSPMDNVANTRMLSTSSLTGFPHVVVVGGGFCGVVVARLLQYNTACDVTLIDPKPYFEYVGALPKSLLNEKFSRVPLATALPHTSIIQGWAESVSDSHVAISIDGEGGSHPVSINITYDHLVLATGSNYPAGIKYSHDHDSKGVSRLMDLKQKKAEVVAAKSILIVGGGLVGVEIATEVKSTYPNKQVTILDRLPCLFPRILGGHELVSNRLEELGILVHLNQEVDRLDPDTHEYVTQSGQRFLVDHAIWCGGPQPNATLVPSLANAFPSQKIATADSHLDADEFLNLKGSNGRVWCGGDICRQTGHAGLGFGGIGEEATAARAIEQGRVIAHNIVQSLKKNAEEEEEQGNKVPLAVYGERSDGTSGGCRDHHNSIMSDKADIPSMIVSLGGNRALVVIDNYPVEGPFRHLKEQVENLFLSQISLGGANSGRLQDPYVLLNKVDTNRLEEYARKNMEPTLRDLLTPELPHLVRDTMNCFVPRATSRQKLRP